MTTLSRSFLRAAKRVVSKDKTRRALTKVELDGQYAVATDGHVLVVVEVDPEGKAVTGRFDPLIEVSGKQAIGTALPVILSRNGEGLMAEQGAATTRHPDSDDPFPQWKGVLPGGWEGDNPTGYEYTFSVNPGLLIRALEAFAKRPIPQMVRVFTKVGRASNGARESSLSGFLMYGEDDDENRVRVLSMPIRDAGTESY
jgi:hypothetical protein